MPADREPTFQDGDGKSVGYSVLLALVICSIEILDSDWTSRPYTQLDRLHRSRSHCRHVGRRLVLLPQGRKSDVGFSILPNTWDERRPANARVCSQSLAKLSHSYVRELFYHVGYDLPPFHLLAHRAANANVFTFTALTFLAQLHPLVVPRRTDLRPETVK